MKTINADQSFAKGARKVLRVGSTYSKCLLLALVVFIGPAISAQRDDVQVPQDDASAKQMEDNITKQKVPTDQVSLYEEIREARTRAEGYKALAARLEDRQKHLPKKDEILKPLEDIASLLPKCRDGKNAEQIQSKLANIRSQIFQFDMFELMPLVQVPAKEICNTVNASSLNEIRSKLSSAWEKKSDLNQKQIEYATRLNTAWQNRFDSLIKEQGSIKTQGDQAQTLLYLLPLLVAIVCAFSVYILRAVKQFDDNPQMELIASGQVVQFPTVMVLLIVITALGLTKILDGNSLSALLGGVGGYVLSQGVGRAAMARAERDLKNRVPSRTETTSDTGLNAPLTKPSEA